MGRGGWGHPVCIISTPQDSTQGDSEYLYLQGGGGHCAQGGGLPEWKAKGKGNRLVLNPTWG